MAGADDAVVMAGGDDAVVGSGNITEHLGTSGSICNHPEAFGSGRAVATICCNVRLQQFVITYGAK